MSIPPEIYKDDRDKNVVHSVRPISPDDFPIERIDRTDDVYTHIDTAHDQDHEFWKRLSEPIGFSECIPEIYNNDSVDNGSHSFKPIYVEDFTVDPINDTDHVETHTDTIYDEVLSRLKKGFKPIDLSEGLDHPGTHRQGVPSLTPYVPLDPVMFTPEYYLLHDEPKFIRRRYPSLTTSYDYTVPTTSYTVTRPVKRSNRTLTTTPYDSGTKPPFDGETTNRSTYNWIQPVWQPRVTPDDELGRRDMPFYSDTTNRSEYVSKAVDRPKRASSAKVDRPKAPFYSETTNAAVYLPKELERSAEKKTKERKEERPKVRFYDETTNRADFVKKSVQPTRVRQPYNRPAEQPPFNDETTNKVEYTAKTEPKSCPAERFIETKKWKARQQDGHWMFRVAFKKRENKEKDDERPATG
uniref:Uncharacterized protein n=1 Tax=Haemonchus contortus TaxID=6289 RepID=A0A7I4YPF9_HAECO